VPIEHLVEAVALTVAGLPFFQLDGDVLIQGGV
jgi:hypothetical protein